MRMKHLFARTAFALAVAAAHGTALAAAPLPAGLPGYAADKPLPVPDIQKKTLANGLEVWVVPRDGIPRVDSSQEGEMLGTATSENAIKKLEGTGVPVMKEGLVRGVTGIMLYEGTFSKKDIICILCPANPQQPDPRAAATALTPLSKIVPNLNIDPTPLNNEANDIDNRVRAQQQAQQEIGTQNIYG